MFGNHPVGNVRKSSSPPLARLVGVRTQGGFALRCGPRVIALDPGEVQVGRGSDCGVAFEGALVSRRHASLQVTDRSVAVRDLGSRNGTFVNDRRIWEATKLKPGDRLLFGDQEAELVARNSPEVAFGPAPGNRQVPAGSTRTCDVDSEARTARAIDLLTGVFEKAIRLGKTEEAERLLTAHFERIVLAARAGQRISPSLYDAAADCSVTLAEATGRATWINTAIQVFSAHNRMLPLAVTDRLYSLLRTLPEQDQAPELLRAYVAQFRASDRGLSATDRFALSRLQGLLRQLAG